MKLRSLSQTGIVTDFADADLPANAFTMGRNVRFSGGRVQRGLVFRDWSTPPNPDNITGVASFRTPAGLETVALCRSTGRITGLTGVVYDDLTPTGWTDKNLTQQWTRATLSGVAYLATPGLGSPLYHVPGTPTRFAALPGWPSGEEAGTIRAYRDFLIALRVVKSGVPQPSLVKWSDAALAGAPPASWTAGPETLAGENPLAQMRDPLIDGAVLGPAFMLYSRSEAYRMQFVGGNDVFAFEKAFEGGVIAPNCVVEVDGQHYVFGHEDIFVTDGLRRTSIAQGRVKDYVYQNLTRSLAARCFVYFDETLREVHFCYHSNAPEVALPGSSWANTAAVYNIDEGHWSFIDLPNAVAADLATASNVGVQWGAVVGSWNALGGAWSGDSDTLKRAPVIVSRAMGSDLPFTKLLIGDTITRSRITLPLYLPSVRRAWLRREGLDLDEVDPSPHGYKLMTSAVPQGHTRDVRTQTMWRFGAADIPQDMVEWGPWLSFDPSVDLKVDHMMAGRYLAYELAQETQEDFSVSAINFIVKPLSRA